MPIAKVHPTQLVEQRFRAAIVDLVVQGPEVFSVAALRRVNGQRSITSLKSPRGLMKWMDSLWLTQSRKCNRGPNV
jgi:hypothetical protein